MVNEIMEIMFIMIFCTLMVSKIKILKNLNFLKKILINIIILVMMALSNPFLLAMYLGLFLVTEMFYYIFEASPYKIKKVDKVVISSIVSTFITIFLLYLFKNQIIEYIDMGLVELRANMKNLAVNSQEYIYIKEAEKNIIQGVKMLREHILINVFSTSVLCTLGIYLSLDNEREEYWELSFEWLLLYIIPFFLTSLFNIDNHYLVELGEIGLGIFSLYGAIIVYNLLNKFSRLKYISAGLALYMLLYSNVLVLTIGIVISYMPKLLFKEKKQK